MWLRRFLGADPAKTASTDAEKAREEAAQTERDARAAARQAKAEQARQAKAEQARVRSRRAADRRAERQAAQSKAEAEAEAIKRRFGRSSKTLGLLEAAERFECAECGRWAEVTPAAQAYSRLVKVNLTLSPKQMENLRVVARAGVKPAYLQREFGIEYDDAVRILDTAVNLGLLEVEGKRVVVGLPQCAQCYERRASPQAALVPRVDAREAIAPQLRFRVLQRDGFRCQYCGRAVRDGAVLHLDHVVPVAAGGETSEGNLVTSCEQCNVGKSDAPIPGI